MVELEIKPGPSRRVRLVLILGLSTFLALLLAYLLTSGRGGMFASKSKIYTDLADATGVSDGTPVRLSGIRIGAVSAVSLTTRLDPEHAVHIEMTVGTRYLKDIPIDSTTAVGALTLIGDKYIDINEGKSAAPLPPDGTLQSEPVKQAAVRADLIQALAEELRRVDALLVTMSDPNSRLGHFLVGEDEYDMLLERINGFDRALRGLVSPENPLGEMLFTSNVYNRVHTQVTRADSALESIQRGEGTAGQWFVNDKQYDDLIQRVRKLRDSLESAQSGQGAAGALLQNDAAYARFSAALKGIDSFLSDLDSGDSRTAQMMRNAQLYESLNGFLRSTEDFLRDFRENPQKYLRYKVFGKKKRAASR